MPYIHVFSKARNGKRVQHSGVFVPEDIFEDPEKLEAAARSYCDLGYCNSWPYDGWSYSDFPLTVALQKATASVVDGEIVDDVLGAIGLILIENWRERLARGDSPEELGADFEKLIDDLRHVKDDLAPRFHDPDTGSQVKARGR